MVSHLLHTAETWVYAIMPRRKAAERGLTVQVYMQSVLFNRDPAPLPGGRPKGRRTSRPQVMHQEELQMLTRDQEDELSLTG